MSSTSPVPAENPEASAAPTECTYDESFRAYLACNKQRFSTTQLVGAGIGVTVLIFALAFGLIWVCRRKRAPSKSRSGVNEREGAEVKGQDEESTVDGDSIIDLDSEDDDHDHDAREKEVGPTDPKGLNGVTPVPLEKGAISDRPDVRNRPSDAKSIRSVRVPPIARLGNEMKIPIQNGRLSAPSSRASSHAGSPTESHSIRNLYPSNPDNTPRSTIYGAPPGPGLRPVSTFSQSGHLATQHEVKPPLPAQQSRQGVTANYRPITSSGLKPTGLRAYPSRGSSVTGSRRPSIAPSDRSSGVLPSDGDHIETMTPTPSTRIDSKQPNSGSFPAKPLADRPFASRSGSIVSTASRSASRTSVASRKSFYASPARNVEPAMPPPPYPAGEVLVRPQPAGSGTIISQMGEARMSSTVSVREEFVDAHESLEGGSSTPSLKPKPAPRRQQAIRASSDLSAAQL